jgi:hypothetical protein
VDQSGSSSSSESENNETSSFIPKNCILSDGESYIDHMPIREERVSRLKILFFVIFSLGFWCCCRKKKTSVLILSEQKLIYFRQYGASYWQTSYYIDTLGAGTHTWRKREFKCLEYLCCKPLCFACCCIPVTHSTIKLHFASEDISNALEGIASKLLGELSAADITLELENTKADGTERVNEFVGNLMEQVPAFTLLGKRRREHYKLSRGNIKSSMMSVDVIPINKNQVALGATERVLDAIAVVKKPFEWKGKYTVIYLILTGWMLLLVGIGWLVWILLTLMISGCVVCQTSPKCVKRKIRRQYICCTDRRVFYFSNKNLAKSYEQEMSFYLISGVTSGEFHLNPYRCGHPSYASLKFTVRPSASFEYALARIDEKRMREFFLSVVSSDYSEPFSGMNLPAIDFENLDPKNKFKMLKLKDEEVYAKVNLLSTTLPSLCVCMAMCCTLGKRPYRTKGFLLVTNKRLVLLKHNYAGSRLLNESQRFWLITAVARLTLSSSAGTCCAPRRNLLGLVMDDPDTSGDATVEHFSLDQRDHKGVREIYRLLGSSHPDDFTDESSSDDNAVVAEGKTVDGEEEEGVIPEGEADPEVILAAKAMEEEEKEKEMPAENDTFASDHEEEAEEEKEDEKDDKDLVPAVIATEDENEEEKEKRRKEKEEEKERRRKEKEEKRARKEEKEKKRAAKEEQRAREKAAEEEKEKKQKEKEKEKAEEAEAEAEKEKEKEKEKEHAEEKSGDDVSGADDNAEMSEERRKKKERKQRKKLEKQKSVKEAKEMEKESKEMDFIFGGDTLAEDAVATPEVVPAAEPTPDPML